MAPPRGVNPATLCAPHGAHAPAEAGTALQMRPGMGDLSRDAARRTGRRDLFSGRSDLTTAHLGAAALDDLVPEDDLRSGSSVDTLRAAVLAKLA